MSSFTEVQSGRRKRGSVDRNHTNVKRRIQLQETVSGQIAGREQRAAGFSEEQRHDDRDMVKCS